MASVVKCFAIDGIDGYPVDIEIKTLEGQPMISIIGLGDQAVKEASERVQAAIDETGYIFPKKRVIISLAPSDKKKVVLILTSLWQLVSYSKMRIWQLKIFLNMDL